MVVRGAGSNHRSIFDLFGIATSFWCPNPPRATRGAHGLPQRPGAKVTELDAGLGTIDEDPASGVAFGVVFRASEGTSEEGSVLPLHYPRSGGRIPECAPLQPAPALHTAAPATRRKEGAPTSPSDPAQQSLQLSGSRRYVPRNGCCPTPGLLQSHTPFGKMVFSRVSSAPLKGTA